MYRKLLLLHYRLHVELRAYEAGISDGFVDLAGISFWRAVILALVRVKMHLLGGNLLMRCSGVDVAGRLLLLLFGLLLGGLSLLLLGLRVGRLHLGYDPVYPALEHGLL